jgi:hypothetical protein
MPDGFEKEVLMISGTLAGFVAAVLSIVEKFLNLHNRMKNGKSQAAAGAPDDRASEPSIRTEPWNPKFLQKVSYLLLYETGVIVAAGILLNYVGLTLSRHLQSILFLDMTGTALVSFLLGPWWGAIVALVSNSVVNWLLFPENGSEVIIFPWSLVNMTGALFWGYMARLSGFSRYLKTGRTSAFSHGWFLCVFGVLGAVVMSVPGTLVQAALGEKTIFALNPEVAEVVSQRVTVWEDAVRAHLSTVLGFSWGDSLAWIIVNWLQNCIRYIPDKTMSAAIALVVLKYAYPLFERELIHGGTDRSRPGDERALPLVLGLLYAPSFATLMTAEHYAGMAYWPLWSSPWVVILIGVVLINSWGRSYSELWDARLERSARYAKALRPIGREPSYEFCRRLTFTTLIASLLFALCLPILLVDFHRVTFNFFCVVYGFLLAVHLVRVAIAQNLSVARIED